MQGEELAAVFGTAGAVLAVGLNLPQAWTSCVRRQVAGLSPAARWLAALQAATWVAYGVSVGSGVQVATNVVCGVLHVAVLLALLSLSPQARALAGRHGLVAAGWAVLVLATAATGAGALGTLAAACATASLVPQLVHLVRERSASTSGVSRTSTRLAVACNLAWALHGLLLGAPAVWAPSLLAVTAAVATLALLRVPAPAVVVPAPRLPLEAPRLRSADELALAA